MPRSACIPKLTHAMATQQHAPKTMGFAPDFTRPTRSVFRPIAIIAITMKYYESIFNGLNNVGSTPAVVATVVMIEATTNHRMNIGNARFRLNAFPPSAV